MLSFCANIELAYMVEMKIVDEQRAESVVELRAWAVEAKRCAVPRSSEAGKSSQAEPDTQEQPSRQEQPGRERKKARSSQRRTSREADGKQTKEST